MEQFTFLTTIALFAFLIYVTITNRKDMLKKDDLIRDLTLKFMSKDVSEYLSATPQKEEKVEEEVDVHIPIEDVPFDKLDKAVDEL
jgi:hypothetical protein